MTPAGGLHTLLYYGWRISTSRFVSVPARIILDFVRGMPVSSAQNEVFHQRLLFLSPADNGELDQVHAFLYLSPYQVIRLLPHG